MATHATPIRRQTHETLHSTKRLALVPHEPVHIGTLSMRKYVLPELIFSPFQGDVYSLIGHTTQPFLPKPNAARAIYEFNFYNSDEFEHKVASLPQRLIFQSKSQRHFYAHRYTYTKDEKESTQDTRQQN